MQILNIGGGWGKASTFKIRFFPIFKLCGQHSPLTNKGIVEVEELCIALSNINKPNGPQ